MKYLCLAYESEATLDALNPEEWDALRRETLDYVETLRGNGRLIAANALQSVRTAATARVRNGKAMITDGPFAETKETLGGFFLIEATDMNDAIQMALKWPSARIGSIEVRPIEETLRLESRYGGIQGSSHRSSTS
ncbi:YciI family protein [Methyloterricola oryzae]|uniref:YciI family protein n=1 Tax=Methyloterricola oryzae TaxID=1495050 RepID=UPI0005EBBCC5|nr:YciI family protein [Methyloterricola oryzae]